MSALTNRLFRLYHRVIGSIAFYPDRKSVV